MGVFALSTTISHPLMVRHYTAIVIGMKMATPERVACRESWHKTRMNQLMDNCDHDELAELIDPPVIIGALLYIAALVCLTLVLSALGS
jgi:hypothetical protein